MSYSLSPSSLLSDPFDGYSRTPRTDMVDTLLLLNVDVSRSLRERAHAVWKQLTQHRWSSQIALALRINLSTTVLNRACPPWISIKRRYLASRNAQANQQHCAFYKLPAELHLCIARYLDGADLEAYTQCSRTTTFLTSHHPRISWPQKARFSMRLRRDQVLRAAALQGVKPDIVAWCSHHSMLHHTSLFAAEQLQPYLSGDDRVCIGVTGRFRVCEHRSFNTEELFWESLGLPRDLLLCNQHAKPEGDMFGPYFNSEYSSFPPVCVYTRRHLVLRVPFGQEVSKQCVSERLLSLGIHICPHLGTAHPNFGESLFQTDAAKFHGKKALAGSKMAFAVTASCGRCSAKYTLRRHEGGDAVLLIVRRKIQDLYRPHSVDVLVQLEDCGIVCCGYDGTFKCEQRRAAFRRNASQ